MVTKINTDLNHAVRAPQFSERFHESAIEPVGGSQKEFATYVAAELKKWSGVAKEAGIRIEQ